GMTDEAGAGLDRTHWVKQLFRELGRVWTQHGVQPPAFPAALLGLLLAIFLAVLPYADAPVDVMPAPPAPQGRQIVGGGGRQRIRRPFAGRCEARVAVPLEQQYAHAEDSPRDEFFAQALGNRAQV